MPSVPLPRRLHLEVTNRCNSLCETCVRTFGPPPGRDLSLAEVERIVGELPALESVALQVNGESLLAPDLVPIVRLLRSRGVRAELNTNAISLDERLGGALVDAGLAALNVSFDGATAATYAAIRGVDAFDRVVANTTAFLRLRGPTPATPRVSLWMTASRHDLPELPALVELAARMGAEEVHLQRLVHLGRGLARRLDSLHGALGPEHELVLRDAEERARRAGVVLAACGRHSPQTMLAASPDPEPWRACERPWTSAVVMADGAVLPCCISSFVAEGDAAVMGNVLEQGWTAIWDGERYARFRASFAADQPGTPFCHSCGVRWSL